ncbi:MAG: hypothetical protein RSA00_08355, partial [Hydrogenoanaerobacterium sp.]
LARAHAVLSLSFHSRCFTHSCFTTAASPPPQAASEKPKFMQVYGKQQPVHPPPQAASEENKIYASLR